MCAYNLVVKISLCNRGYLSSNLNCHTMHFMFQHFQSVISSSASGSMLVENTLDTKIRLKKTPCFPNLKEALRVDKLTRQGWW